MNPETTRATEMPRGHRGSRTVARTGQTERVGNRQKDLPERKTPASQNVAMRRNQYL